MVPSLPLLSCESPVSVKENPDRKKKKINKTNKKEYKLFCKVRDLCHFTGKYRGAAHSKCNLKYKVPRFAPVLFHNGSKYDNHFIIKQLAKDFKVYFNCIGEVFSPIQLK